MRVRAAGKTDTGLKRKLNEDSFLVAPDLGLYVLADGMGGHKAGEVASRIVVDTMADYWRKMRGGRPPSFLTPIQEEMSQSANHLVNSIVLANIIIHEAQKKPQYHRMGSTVSALLEERDSIWIANVGDSPVYILDRGCLVLISEVHSMEAERKSHGLATNDSLGSTNLFLKNILTRVLGLHERVNVYIHAIHPKAGDLVMMCSDGLTNYVSEQMIKRILELTIPIERKLDLLIHEANHGGGGDNVSVILLEVLSEGKWQRFKRMISGPERVGGERVA